MIKCVSVSKTFRTGGLKKNGTPVLKNIDCEIKAFSVTGITGESGCGKTTLARCLMNLIKPDSGNIFIKGKSVFEYTDKKAFCRLVQTVQQNPESALDPDFTVKKSLEEVYILHKERFASKAAFQAELQELCIQTGIPYDETDKLPYAFSGGQLQRICIIRALLIKPEIVILDESTSMLDVSVQAQILSLLLKLKERYKLTLILISHDLDVIEYFCDELIVMQKGTIVESGACSKIFANPTHEYTIKLLKNRNLILE
jgi:dipeptide ABC transporter, ATP-binding protein dppF